MAGRFNFEGMTAEELILMREEVSDIEVDYLEEDEAEALAEGIEALDEAIDEAERTEKEASEKKEKEESEDKQVSKSKKRKAISRSKRKAFWDYQIEEALNRIESKTGVINWKNSDQRGEVINGYLKEEHIFEIKRGFSMYTLRIIDNNLKESYHKKTRFLTHNSPHYGKLKQKASDIADKFLNLKDK